MTNWVIIKLITFILNNQLKYQRHKICLFIYILIQSGNDFRMGSGTLSGMNSAKSSECVLEGAQDQASRKGVSRKSARHIRSARRHDIFGLLLPVTQMWRRTNVLKTLIKSIRKYIYSQYKISNFTNLALFRMINWVIIKLFTFIFNNQLKYQRRTNMFIHLYTYLFWKRCLNEFRNSFQDEFSNEFGMRPGIGSG